MRNKIPQPKLVGFFPKLPCPEKDWIENDTVKEICSVSDCVAKGPENWIEEWEHNDLGFYDSEEKIIKILGDEKEKYNFYAYKLYPLKFNKGKAENCPISIDLKADVSDYEFLGFDIVSKSQSDFFECSPLSCNDLCKTYIVNQCCLIENLENAYLYCIEIEKEKCEPGPYYLFEVYRKKSNSGDTVKL
ncbi:MAG: hypothetical protein A2167_03165 [Planctomycetes bacterium RBG_13_46_10]|nr:MAG: hypothetical protein A2167_03165 [Planctomycetes bacterium RBG_13_46_10]